MLTADSQIRHTLVRVHLCIDSKVFTPTTPHPMPFPTSEVVGLLVAQTILFYSLYLQGWQQHGQLIPLPLICNSQVRLSLCTCHPIVHQRPRPEMPRELSHSPQHQGSSIDSLSGFRLHAQRPPPCHWGPPGEKGE